jgi:hypothetical protein
MDDHKEEKDEDLRFKVQQVSGFRDGKPQTVNFINLLGADSQFEHTSVPAEYQNHCLIRNRFFYTIPEQLLQAVCEPQTGETLGTDEALLQMEGTLSQLSGDHGSRVGFWNDTPIDCTLMATMPLLRRQDLAQFGNLSEEAISDCLRAANEHLLSFAGISCGYAGWLMTNPTFLSEFDALREEFGQQMNEWGTSIVGLPIPSTQPAGLFNPTGEQGWNEYDTAVLEFCVRWRLQGLAGPRIPIPMRPMMGGHFPLSVVEQLMRAGGVFNWPDTFPIFARDELRELLTTALQRPESSEHLSEWHHIISSSNKAKNQIGPFERRFRLQHFWRLLRERHAKAFNRRLNRIERAFAEYFGVDETTIRLDRTVISKALGKTWDGPKEEESPFRRPPK